MHATTGKATETSPVSGAVVVVVADLAALAGETRVVEGDPTNDEPHPVNTTPVTPRRPSFKIPWPHAVVLLGADDKPTGPESGGSPEAGPSPPGDGPG